MKTTPTFDFPYPEESDTPAGPAQIEGLAEKAESVLSPIEELLLGVPAPGNLVIVNGTSDPVYKAVTGDLAINSAGVATIGDGAVSSRKLKPTVGRKVSSKILTLTEAYQDIEGAALEITPAVPSILFVVANFTFEVKGVSTEPFGKATGAITFDGTNWPVANYSGNVNTSQATVSGPMLFELSAAAHTIKLRAKRNAAPEVKVESGSMTSFTYLLFAA